MAMKNIDRIQDPTVRLKVSAKLLNYIRNNSVLAKEIGADIELLNANQLRLIKKTLSGSKHFLTGKDLVQAIEEFSNTGKALDGSDLDLSDMNLHDYLSEITIILPENGEIVRNPILKARVEKLQLEQSEREYKQITKSVSSRKTHPEDSIGYQLKMMNRHLIAVVQVIFSVAAGFAFGFVGIPLILGYLEFGYRILLGLFFALIIAVAELYFLGKHLIEDDDGSSRGFNLNNRKLHTD